MIHRKETPLDGAMWVAPTYPVDCVTVKKSFLINNKKGAKLYITGLGYFEAKVNGKKLTDDILIPPASDYLPRDLSHAEYPIFDEMTHRIYYHEFDVEEALVEGENTLSVELGGGWFTQSERVAEGNMAYGDSPITIFKLVTDSDIITSDGTESFFENEIRQSRLFIGEVIDARFSDSKAKPVRVFPLAESILSPAIGINDGYIRDIEPKLIFSEAGRKVYDTGENISAVVSMTSSLPSGARCTVRYSENINDDFSLNFKSTGSSYIGTSGEHQIMTDVFISDGTRREYCPKFVWHAFRYFEVLSDLDFDGSVTVREVRSKVKVDSAFDSDSEGANFLYDAYIRTQLSSYHGSHPSDCPHRERLGYTGDGQICAEAAMLLLSSEELYRKWIRDILDCQDKNTGHVQHTAPFQGGGGGPGGWSSAIVTVPYAFCKIFGKLDILNEALPAMRRWIDFTEASSDDGLVMREIEGGWCLGDWCYLESAKLPEPFVNTCWFIHTLRLYTELCDIAGVSFDNKIEKLLEGSLSAVRKAYSELSTIGAAKLYAAWIGIEDARCVTEHYDSLGHIDTGFLGTDILFDTLFKYGGEDVSYKLLKSDEPGSYLYMKRRGATTLYETWRGDNSHSHPMFGAAAGRLFTGLLGIRQPRGSIGFTKLVISPRLPKKMNRAKGFVTTPKGKIEVSLLRESENLNISVTIPEGVCAVLDLYGELTELAAGRSNFTFKK